ncbi:MAG: zinc-dependent alcohol dehydrogenase [Bacteroidota bacterium]
MKALVFHGPRSVSVDTVDDPAIKEPTDAILKITSTAICGSDLHIYNGLVPQARDLVLGHEFMGIVEEVGKGVTKLKKGDRVVVPFPIACGKCWFCSHEMPTHCETSNSENYGPEGGVLTDKGAALFGYTDLYGGYDGGQAELVRVPYADFGPRKVPDSMTDEQVLFLTDIFPTGWSAIDWAQLKGGETVAIFGAGPVGIMAMKAAWAQGAGRVIAIDTRDYRLEIAKKAGKAETINIDKENATEIIRSMTGGRGADVCVDAVGMEPDMNILEKAAVTLGGQGGSGKVMNETLSAVRRGGTVTIVGLYATPYNNFPWGQAFEKGVMMRMGQAPVHNYIDKLIKLVTSGEIVLDDIITHKLPLKEAAHGYKIFNDRDDNCLKVVLKP